MRAGLTWSASDCEGQRQQALATLPYRDWLEVTLYSPEAYQNIRRDNPHLGGLRVLLDRDADRITLSTGGDTEHRYLDAAVREERPRLSRLQRRVSTTCPHGDARWLITELRFSYLS